ncbi:MAG: hypothetical protein CMM93_01885 [Rickettsiales bacterium]|nr:hypothetical protein [Rickettsiales bacterium]|tara:strand:- start:6357 stop:7049 length:693 start_codon:yes stop_codon:yes gene_type:complete
MKYLLISMLIAVATPAMAEEALVRQVSVTGEAKESLKPDLVSVSATVVGRDMDLDKAKSQHDDRLRNLLQVAKDFGISGKDLSTGYGSIQPVWNWENNTQVFKGYVVETSIDFRMRKLERTGELLEAIVKVKPERMQGPSYTIEETKPIQDRLRIAAVSDAKKRAEALAKETGMKLGSPVSISDSWRMPQPMVKQMAFAQELSARAAPVNPPEGEQEVQATVNIVYEIKE